MRNKFADTFFECAQKDDRLAMIVADISPAGSIQKFRETYPDRFINTGVAEQIMIGMAAGMALKGMRPFCYTIATFALYRPFEFIRDDLAYQNLPVTIVGIGGGLTYSTLGATHHAMEDIAVASSIPNLQVLAPCDPYEVAEATRYCAERTTGGPIYMRLGKAGEPTFMGTNWEWGQLRWLQTSGGSYDTCILTYGSIAKLALQVAAEMESALGRSSAVASVHTIVPFPKDVIADLLRKFRHVYVIEEHIMHGGLGARVVSLLAETGAKCQVLTFGLDDKFNHVYGTHEELLASHQMTLADIMREVQ